MTTYSLQHYALSHPGGRAINEDAYCCNQRKNYFCFTVADGLGGHDGGDIASRLATDAVTHFIETESISLDSLESCIKYADSVIRQRQASDTKLQDMHTTIVTLLSDGVHAVWGHAGDSRLYHFRNGQCIARTRDHTVSQVMSRVRNISQDNQMHKNRNALFRCLGDTDPVNPKITSSCKLMPQDAFLLCTDGYWAHIAEEEMIADLARSHTPQQWLEQMTVQRLKPRITARHDNYTAIGVFVQ